MADHANNKIVGGIESSSELSRPSRAPVEWIADEGLDTGILNLNTVLPRIHTRPIHPLLEATPKAILYAQHRGPFTVEELQEVAHLLTTRVLRFLKQTLLPEEFAGLRIARASGEKIPPGKGPQGVSEKQWHVDARLNGHGIPFGLEDDENRLRKAIIIVSGPPEPLFLKIRNIHLQIRQFDKDRIHEITQARIREGDAFKIPAGRVVEFRLNEYHSATLNETAQDLIRYIFIGTVPIVG